MDLKETGRSSSIRLWCMYFVKFCGLRSVCSEFVPTVYQCVRPHVRCGFPSGRLWSRVGPRDSYACGCLSVSAGRPALGVPAVSSVSWCWLWRGRFAPLVIREEAWSWWRLAVRGKDGMSGLRKAGGWGEAGLQGGSPGPPPSAPTFWVSGSASPPGARPPATLQAPVPPAGWAPSTLVSTALPIPADTPPARLPPALTRLLSHAVGVLPSDRLRTATLQGPFKTIKWCHSLFQRCGDCLWLFD